MPEPVKIHPFPTLRKLAQRLRDDFYSGDQDFVLIFAYNGVGKTRLTMEFKELGKDKDDPEKRDTLYFNAFTEDLFTWDNDLDNNTERYLKLNTDSKFFAGLDALEMDNRIGPLIERYTDMRFQIDTEAWVVRFSREVAVGDGHRLEEGIKISRGEENLFIWCFFLAVVQLALDKEIDAYNWVKYIYVDDPISSLDENNAIAVAHDLAKVLRGAKDLVKVIVSSHHALFFNVMCNELKPQRHKRYFLHRPDRGESYTLRATDSTPFFHHVAMLSEVQRAADSGDLYTYHFNMLRNVMEKTAVFFGRQDFSTCLAGVEDEGLFARALNLLSHGQYSLFEPVEMIEDNKELFRQMLAAFLDKHAFELPMILAAEAKDEP